MNAILTTKRMNHIAFALLLAALSTAQASTLTSPTLTATLADRFDGRFEIADTGNGWSEISMTQPLCVHCDHGHKAASLVPLFSLTAQSGRIDAIEIHAGGTYHIAKDATIGAVGARLSASIRGDDKRRQGADRFLAANNPIAPKDKSGTWTADIERALTGSEHAKVKLTARLFAATGVNDPWICLQKLTLRVRLAGAAGSIPQPVPLPGGLGMFSAAILLAATKWFRRKA